VNEADRIPSQELCLPLDLLSPFTKSNALMTQNLGGVFPISSISVPI